MTNPNPPRIELVHAVLGLRPYILIEFKAGDDGDDDLRATINAGGGIGTVKDIRSAMGLALANLPDDGAPVGGSDG